MTTIGETSMPATKGLVMHSEARYYDVLAWLFTLGRERAFRERLVALARLAPGEAVLDVGCGTGTLAVATKRHVGAAGTVHGVDASPEMIERAKRKAARAGADVAFQTAVVEALPFPDASFDAVLSTLMLHHLPRPVRAQCAREMRRVLKPGGRVLAVDFATPARERTGLLARMHRHGHMKLRDIVELMEEVGLVVEEMGAVGVGDLRFAVATAPRLGEDRRQRQPPASRSLPPLPAPRWLWAALALAVVAGHAVAPGAVMSSSRLVLSAAAAAAVIGALAVGHFGLAGAAHTLLRRRSRR